MKRCAVVISVVTLACVGVCGAGTSVVKNGSFENDGYMNVTPTSIPEYWCNVGYDGSKFEAHINNSWSTHGNYSLTMDSFMYIDFVQNDSATITQSVYLTNAEQIIFDVYLYADDGGWRTDLITASVLIDDTEIWNSDGLTYTSGRFMGQVSIDINDRFKDSKPHNLTLQLKADTSGFHLNAYFAKWDAIGLSTTCGNTGYLPSDFTHDCVVDINDLKVFADGWLTPNGLGLTGDNDVNFADFAILANSWMIDTRGEPFIPDPNFVFLDSDLNDDGIVDFVDFAIFGNNWRGQGGSCVREDLNADGVIDFKDLAILAGQWQEIGDLYGL